MTDDVSVLGENQELALFFDEDDSLEESIFFLANKQIEKNRKDVVNNIISACPALAEIVNGLHETEQLRLVFSDEVKMGLENGIYKMMKAKDAAGGFKAIVVDQAGKIKNIPDVAVDKALVGVNSAQMAMAMQGMAIQQQLQDISEQLGEISMALNDVLAGQHNDRLAKYFAGASLYKEALSVSDDELRKDLTNSALMMLSDAYSELSVSLKYQIDKICSKYDEKSGSLKKIKTDELCNEMVKINSSFQAIHKAIALKTAIYYKNGEYSACTTVLNEYGKFLTKTLPKEKADILYLADPNDKGFAGVWNDRKEELPLKINQVKEKLVNLSEYRIEINEEDVKWNTNVQNAAM